jgi:DNA-binding MarR family transcriptional regulator
MDHLDAARALAADCLCFRARRTARAITRAYDAALRPTGLQATQLTLIAAVALGEGGAQPMARLSEMLALELSTLTRNLRPLEAAGILEVIRSPGDRRVRLVRLTPAGQARLVEAMAHWTRAHAEVRAALGEATAGALHTALDAATRAMQPVPAGRT